MVRRAQRNTKSNAPALDDAPTKVRLDKWLFAARFFKTRALAAAAVDAGKVKLDGDRLKTSHEVKLGEHYVIGKDSFTWAIEVTLVTDARGNGAAAALMYQESAESLTKREAEMLQRKGA